jgi:N-acyl-D-amino-acid deacylase
LAETRPAITLVPSIVHNAVRDLVMDGADREEIRAMRVEVQLGFEAGARTLSFGLIYMPGAFSDIEELIELAEAGMQDSAIAALEVTISRSGC